MMIGVLFLAACQKEVSVDTGGNPGSGGGGGGSTTGDLLVKVVQKSGADTSETVYQYDASKRLLQESLKGVSQGQGFTLSTRVVRNASGIITNVIQKSDDFAAQGIDSIVSVITYDAAAGRYTKRITTIELFGFEVIDSTIAVYNAAGQIIREESYLISPLLGTGAEITSRSEYVYDAAGNPVELRLSAADPTSGTPLELVGTNKFTYDTKTSPLKLSIGEAFAFGRSTMVAANNPVKDEFLDATTPANNFTFNYVHTYNTKNKPVTTVGTETPGGAVTNITYTYQ